MILYFSGTGNSRFAAQELGRQLDDNVISINKCMHCMACISICPVRSINYGSKTKNRERYYLY